MIIADKCSRPLILLLLCAVILLRSSGCNKAPMDSAYASLESLVNSNGAERGEYRIILPTDASVELCDAAHRLSVSLQEQTRYECSIYFEDATLPQGENTVLVFLGRVGVSDFEHLLRDDYIYRAMDGYVIIGGGSDKATVAAIERFEADVLPYCESGDITKYEGNFEHRGEYSLEALVLCGVDFSEYDIVCTTVRRGAVADVVLKLRELVADKCGAYPRIFFDKSPKQQRREIVLSLDEHMDNSAYIDYDGEDILLCAADTYGLSMAAYKLYGMLFENIMGNAAVCDITHLSTYTYSPQSIEVELAFVSAGYGDPLNTAKTMLDGVLNSSVGMVIYNNVDAELWELLQNGSGTALGCRELRRDDTGVSGFIYKRSDIESVSVASDALDGVTVYAVSVKFAADERLESLYIFSESDASKRHTVISEMNEYLTEIGNASAVLLCADASHVEWVGDNIDIYLNSEFAASNGQVRVLIMAVGNIECKCVSPTEDQNALRIKYSIETDIFSAFSSL